LSIKFTIIITAEKKERYILETIKSCLKQSLLRKFRIIVVYSKLNNEKLVKNRFLDLKNLIFLKCPLKKISPTNDQLFKIEMATKFLKDEWVLLLDGDDLFLEKKLKTLQTLNLNKNKVYLHDHQIITGKTLSNSTKHKNYKKLFLYKFLFNDWPEKINTSSILLSSKTLKNFYKTANPYQWKYLAIDVQLVLHFYYKNKFVFLSKILTLKRENINNLDKKYSNYFSKIYWLRRLEQHNMTEKNSHKKNFFDRVITLFFLKIFIY
jgi:glycosyltransferase involved in cell wall biosynthesis|tara:strand:+ start:3675 stop:4469 length:795 start_codon:yes stop_codon:yes gene_type:complete